MTLFTHWRAVLHAGLCLSLFCAAAPAAASPFRLFGTREVISSNLAAFPKWQGMLQRDTLQRPELMAACIKDAAHCPARRWLELVDKAKGKPFAEMLGMVNRELNRSKYTLDILNWGKEDYWETPQEFLTHDGDCEDYAIIKYMTLKILGIPVSEMRIVVLEDHNLNLLHSVLAVRHDGVNYILDNQITQVVADTTIHHYVPIYSINEQNWWRHIVY